MVDAQTPVKKHQFDCFSCFDRNVRTFKLGGKKLNDDQFISTLHMLLNNDELYQTLLSSEAGLCRNCNLKIENISTFTSTLRNSSASFSSTTYSKRGAKSPLTPKSLTDSIDTCTSVPTVPRSKKKLRLSDTDTVEKEKENVQPITIL